VVTGSPARSATWRAMFCPVAPSGSAQPKMTSSTSEGSTPARLTASFTTCPPSVAPWVLLKAPRYALPIPVRAVETMTASGMNRPSRRRLLQEILLRGRPSGPLGGETARDLFDAEAVTLGGRSDEQVRTLSFARQIDPEPAH